MYEALDSSFGMTKKHYTALTVFGFTDNIHSVIAGAVRNNQFSAKSLRGWTLTTF